MQNTCKPLRRGLLVQIFESTIRVIGAQVFEEMYVYEAIQMLRVSRGLHSVGRVTEISTESCSRHFSQYMTGQSVVLVLVEWVTTPTLFLSNLIFSV